MSETDSRHGQLCCLIRQMEQQPTYLRSIAVGSNMAMSRRLSAGQLLLLSLLHLLLLARSAWLAVTAWQFTPARNARQMLCCSMCVCKSPAFCWPWSPICSSNPIRLPHLLADEPAGAQQKSCICSWRRGENAKLACWTKTY